MVAAVGDHDVAFGGEGEALGAVQGAAQRIHVGEEWPELIKHLDPEIGEELFKFKYWEDGQRVM